MVKNFRKAFRGVRYILPLMSAVFRRALNYGRRPRFPHSAEKLLSDFSRKSPLSTESYEKLFQYFAQGWAVYRTEDGSRAEYPGFSSWSGRQVDELEGYSRIMPLFGAWCASGRSPEVQLPSGEVLTLPDEFEQGLREGTRRDSDFYWGDMPGKSNQRIVEAADIALALWFFRDTVWSRLPTVQRDAVIQWLLQVKDRPGLDNNWHLFFILIDRVLAALDVTERIPDAGKRWKRIKEFHLGDGWFEDGPGGNVDYYNAWGFHYLLHWIDRIDPEWDPGFIHACQRRFLSTYKYLLSPRGFPVLGRSICYRIAAPAPLILGHEKYSDTITAGEARRALDTVWTYFIRHGAVARGTVSQGYWRTDPRILDNYSGPASSLWSLRSLTAAFSLSPAENFWKSPPKPLPAERSDFEISIDGPGWTVRGERATGRISIEITANPEDAVYPLEPFGLRERVRGGIFGEALRPENGKAKYRQRMYHSDPPFCA